MLLLCSILIEVMIHTVNAKLRGQGRSMAEDGKGVENIAGSTHGTCEAPQASPDVGGTMVSRGSILQASHHTHGGCQPSVHTNIHH